MTLRRKDDVERTTISAHVDRRLVEYLENQRLSKSEWVEKGLRLVLDQTMNDDQFAHKLKMEAKEAEKQIKRAERQLKHINQQAKETLGTTLDDYFEENDPQNMHQQRKEKFIDGWLQEYFERGNSTMECEYIANHVFDIILQRNFGLKGQAATDFVRDCVKQMNPDSNETNAPTRTQSSL